VLSDECLAPVAQVSVGFHLGAVIVNTRRVISPGGSKP